MSDTMNSNSVANRFRPPLNAFVRIANLIGLPGDYADIEGCMQRLTEFRQQLTRSLHIRPIGSIQEQDFGTTIHQNAT